MIKIEHLVKNYGSATAVDDITFSVDAGEIVGFLGPNGAGKSTTMNILTGYLSATAGNLSVDGIDVFANPIEAKRKIGYLPEQPPLYPDMTVEEYLNFIYDLKGCTEDRKKHLEKIADTVKIRDAFHKLIGTLSKGYRQRVGIAEALVGNPPVLVFDEPTVGLDPKQIIEIRNLIRGLGGSHTVILSTHILQEVQAVCDRIVIINKGKIVANEKTENIADMMEGSYRFRVKIAAPQKEALALLKSIPGVSYAEALSERDGDASCFLVESEAGVDIRKKLFFTLAERNFPMVGMESLGMSLEDIFVSVVNRSEEEPDGKISRKPRGRARRSAEDELGGALLEKAEQERREAAREE